LGKKQRQGNHDGVQQTKRYFDCKCSRFLYGEAVGLLISIYDRTPRGEGFLTSDYSKEAENVRRIGSILHEMGGMDEMLEAHARFKMLRPRAARNLEMMWDGIGSWRG
jgi:hypothetical protein